MDHRRPGHFALLRKTPPAFNPCPLTLDHCLSDRFAGYFKFPGDLPPGYLFAMAHGYWPENPPEHIPDRRWEEDFVSTSPWAKIKGTY